MEEDGIVAERVHVDGVHLQGAEKNLVGGVDVAYALQNASMLPESMDLLSLIAVVAATAVVAVAIAVLILQSDGVSKIVQGEVRGETNLPCAFHSPPSQVPFRSVVNSPGARSSADKKIHP